MVDEITWVYNLAITKISKVAQSKCGWLVLERLGLTEIPPSVYELTWIEELIVIDNLIEILPAEIKELNILKHLDLFFNQAIFLRQPRFKGRPGLSATYPAQGPGTHASHAVIRVLVKDAC